MANRAKRKGTRYENRVLERIRAAGWTEAARTSPGSESSDIGGTPWQIECKHRHRWEIAQWARRLEHLTEQWLLFVAPGDGRAKNAPPEIVVMPARQLFELFKQLETAGKMGGPPEGRNDE